MMSKKQKGHAEKTRMERKTTSGAEIGQPEDGAQVDRDELYRDYATRLLEWYDRHQRRLPWRESKDAYYIWVSEVMLQQTRVETVIPYYERFIEQFPTVEALADAPEEQVLKAWEGLGYYSRARNLQTAVREVKEQYGGVVPDDKASFSSLKGVGPYTAGAVLSIAYNKSEPAVDGNVMRVLSRFFLIDDDIARIRTRQAMERLAQALIPEGRAGDFNQALMELGATVCTPRSPSCLTCPVMERCAARLAGRETELPIKTKAKPPRPESRVAAYISGTGDQAGKILIRQRPVQGLLAEMWELPHIEVSRERWDGTDGVLSPEMDVALMQELQAGVERETGLSIQPLSRHMYTTHTFSHIHWNMAVYECRLSGASRAGADSGIWPEASLPPRYVWMGPEEIGQYAFPNVFLRIIRNGSATL